jgi:hypothetical protein
MTGILGYARVSTSDQDVAGQSMRLTEAEPSKYSLMSALAAPWIGQVWLNCSPTPAKAIR